MAYYFMDDYGDEWMITTSNPEFNFHRLIELAADDLLIHVSRGTHCAVVNCYYEADNPISNQFLACYDGKHKGISWSEIMSKSDEETEEQPAWQQSMLKAELNKHWRETVLPYMDNDELYHEKSIVYEKYASERWNEFYSKNNKSKCLVD